MRRQEVDVDKDTARHQVLEDDSVRADPKLSCKVQPQHVDYVAIEVLDGDAESQRDLLRGELLLHGKINRRKRDAGALL